jgi:flagellar FliJ protein
MKRAQRLDTFRASLDEAERECAARLRAAEARVGEARGRLESLVGYRDEYLQDYARRSAAGIGAAALRDYQAFVARLGEAIAQQHRQVGRCEVERDYERARWQEAALQVRAVATVVDRWRDEERVAGERADQREMDERAREISSRAREMTA